MTARLLSARSTVRQIPERLHRAQGYGIHLRGRRSLLLHGRRDLRAITHEREDLPDSFAFVKENTSVKILSYKGKVFGMEAPNFVELRVTKTDPGFKGNTATNTLKPAEVETGTEIRVPLFINEGDMIKIDTAAGSYVERVN